MVFDIFEDEIGGVRIIIEPQSGERPNEDMKMSYAPNFGAPGGHIFDVVALGLKTEETCVWERRPPNKENFTSFSIK